MKKMQKLKLTREDSKSQSAGPAKRISISLVRAPAVTPELRARMVTAAKRRNDEGKYPELREVLT